MSDYYTGYDDFKDLKKDEPELAKELLEERDNDNWQNNPIYKFECVEDFAYYELTDGWYANTITAAQDFNGAPNPLDYVDLTKLGNALVNTWDESIYFLASAGEILGTECGW